MHSWHTRASVWIATSFRLRPRAGHHRPLRHTPAHPERERERERFRERERAHRHTHTRSGHGCGCGCVYVFVCMCVCASACVCVCVCVYFVCAYSCVCDCCHVCRTSHVGLSDDRIRPPCSIEDAASDAKRTRKIFASVAKKHLLEQHSSASILVYLVASSCRTP